MANSNAGSSKTKKKFVVLYTRVSTASQGEGYSLEAQEKALMKHLEYKAEIDRDNYSTDTKHYKVISDVGSGRDMNRAGVQELVEMIKTGKVEAIMVWRIDRYSRNLKHLLTHFELMKQHNVSFASVQENIDFSGHIGQLIFNMFGAIAQFERELIRERSAVGAGTFLSAAQRGFMILMKSFSKMLDRNKTKRTRLQTFNGNFSQLELADKKLLVEVLVDRIEVYREFVINEKGKRASDITIEVVLQFNPQLWGNPIHENRTLKSIPDKAKALSVENIDLDGA